MRGGADSRSRQNTGGGSDPLLVADTTGTLLLVEPVLRPGNEPAPAKYSDLNMLGGREQPAEGFERLYAEAGFRLTNVIRTRSTYNVIEGVPV
jgi:hypothetical protein